MSSLMVYVLSELEFTNDVDEEVKTKLLAQRI